MTITELEEHLKNCKDLKNPADNLTEENRDAIISTIFLCNPNVVYMYETTHHNMQKIKVQRQWLFEITKNHKSYDLIVDLSRSKPPSAEIREGIKTFLNDKMNRIYIYIGSNVLLKLAAKFVLYSVFKDMDYSFVSSREEALKLSVNDN
ncbi:hypothetical protein SAMN04489761_2721 [Tenacibaculum sp. MAR_2009_124]|uniref:hypothetical protein n=1 Tax=Tenacibaculum sp. MAR_2009_124 TaxID=1250059 RepID=UPI00089B350F|nr:hypothetical protein [Tenacibaculum sp. MAR_2009_124]SEC34006.1 hypothetical protein SAMN04489761_2721 [Tenacibaculum sp. MAR_2009_124]